VKLKSGIKQEIYDGTMILLIGRQEFFINSKDPRMLPPKRVKSFEWTINFANPYSVLTLILSVLLIATASMFF
jgi:hypothetical protein